VYDKTGTGADLGFKTGGVKSQNFKRTLKKHQKRYTLIYFYVILVM